MLAYVSHLQGAKTHISRSVDEKSLHAPNLTLPTFPERAFGSRSALLQSVDGSDSSCVAVSSKDTGDNDAAVGDLSRGVKLPLQTGDRGHAIDGTR